jgi:co-chaperonin GroES (HSP10)
MHLREIAEEWERTGDVKGAHLKALGSVEDFELFGDLVLVMAFAERTRTKGGIILTDKSHDEARFQGKVGLVVAVGPQAFADDARVTFGGQKVAVGDWVLTRTSDGIEFTKTQMDGSGGVLMRLFRDTQILARLSDPRQVW